MCRESAYPLSHALEDLPKPYGKKRPPRTCLKLRLGRSRHAKDEEQGFRALYQSRARELLEHCPKSWRDNTTTTPGRQPTVFRGYLEAYGRDEPLGPENEAYIRKAVDSYCACLQRADEVVAAVGLRRPAGAKNCELWEEAFTPAQKEAWGACAGADAAFLEIGARLCPKLCSFRMQDRPYFSKPLQYVTMCIWETTGDNAAYREDIVLQVEEAESRILMRCLLKDHRKWYPTCECLDGGEVEEFRAFFYDNKRGSHRIVPRVFPPPYRADV
ncbi:hypothetical protein VP1G_00535 [Cytospora mali]|uniref:Uncharacterized protein n=1 Tax=Cytospora mali TaxID=578113 RepID=A0A194UMY5_CYTMA|nr:hypothetical protein VP1G_00535 [Valsa mali var. pyri (nom. inval.)]